MADYGAPVFSFLAVGGYESEWPFRHHPLTHEMPTINARRQLTWTLHVLSFPDDDFTNAEAFILTFSLNNYARTHPKFKVAMQWETEFLKIVQDYQKNPATNFTFAYMAEVQWNLQLTCGHSFFKGLLSATLLPSPHFLNS